MGCHTNTQQEQGATITTNIPSTGYQPGNTYNITVAANSGSGLGPKGFEVTCEENTTNTKAGSFGITNPTFTQFTNSSSAVTHTAAGNSLSTWSFNWISPIAGSGDITFYGTFIESGYPIGSNDGDFFNEVTLSFNEATVNSTINVSTENDFSFNSVSKIIESNTILSVYDIRGKLVLVTNSKSTNISHLNQGIYIIKSTIKSKKIILN